MTANIEHSNSPGTEHSHSPGTEHGHSPGAEHGNSPSAEHGHSPGAEHGHSPSTVEVRSRVKRALEASGDLEEMVASARSMSENSRVVLERRYLAKDREGKVIEKPDEMFRRVAHNLAQADRLYGATEEEVQATEEGFYRAMASLDYLPNSPTLMNAGRELQMLSACFVLPVEDSMEAIFETVKQATLVQKSGGGTGFAFSRLRPEGDIVGSTGGVASGPVSFMRAFDGATEAVKQGSTRRGANMGILRVNHPDILRFITSKEDGHSISNFNISVAVTEEFMGKVDKDEEYDLVNPRNGRVEGRLNAREVFELLVEMAWKTGDPGIVFLDRINRDNPTPKLGVIESTNPCGEQPLLPYESCNLGSVNLSQMVRSTEDGIGIDWEKMDGVISVAVHTLENVIDMNDYPIPAIEEYEQADAAHRAGGDGLCRPADPAWHPVRLGGRAGCGRGDNDLYPTQGPPSFGGAGGETGDVPRMAGEHIRPAGRPQDAQLGADDHSADGDHQHHRGLLQRNRAPVCPELCAQRDGPTPCWWRATPYSRLWPSTRASTPWS